MRPMILVLVPVLVLVAMPLGAATPNNDDTCDIGLFPAATLLLPYFEVDIIDAQRESTIFTLTNTGPQPQVARVTLWTDYAYPVLSFNLYLTGYDVQKVNLFDVIARGLIAPDAEMGSDTSPVGELSEHDNQRLDEAACRSLPGALPAVLLQRMQSAFTIGKVPQLASTPACNTAGGVHTNATGYATIDVVGTCTGSIPTDNSYFTHEIRFDNVLMGDFIQINSAQNFAQGNPMVHIRAIPEGGEASTRKKTHLERTFYSRLQPASNNTLDARQPLPAAFGARWINGGQGSFFTFFKVWREAAGTASTLCSAYPANALMKFEAVRFDEEENPETQQCFRCDPPIVLDPRLPAASLAPAANDGLFPPNTLDAVAGWMYLDLDNGLTPDVASQNWVTVSMRAQERFSVDSDATAFGNGCSAPPSATIGPAPNSTN